MELKIVILSLVALAVSASSAPTQEADEGDSVVDNRGDKVLSRCINCAYCTPDYIIGCAMFDVGKETVDRDMGRWSGVIFRDHAAICVRPYTDKKWNVQDRDVMITQNCRGHGYPFWPKIRFVGGMDMVEKDGWVFVDSTEAYAAINIVKGGYRWNEPARLSPMLKDRFSPIIIQTGGKVDYGSFEKFQNDILRAPLTVAKDKLTYTGPNSSRIEFSETGNEEQKVYNAALEAAKQEAEKNLWREIQGGISAEIEDKDIAYELAKAYRKEQTAAHRSRIEAEAIKVAVQTLKAKGIVNPCLFTLPKIDGKTRVLDSEYDCKIPYMECKTGSDVVTIRYGERRWDYDFGKNTVTEVAP